ncbi:MAG: chorismate synthase [Bacillota bacterium]|nr:chorismate synthase [Bacillota bacterium]
MLRYLTAGESHGRALVTIVEGLPAGLPVRVEQIDAQLARRQGGYGRGGRMRIEQDRARILSGVRGGRTLGSPVALLIENRDWANWSEVMAAGPEARVDGRVVTRPRPGHADLAGALKYGHRDLRNVLERASARETAARVAAGSLARRLLEELGIEIVGMVVRVGTETAQVPDKRPDELRARAAASAVMCPDQVASQHMMEAIDRARDTGDTLGGVFEVHAYGVPPGLGSHVHWDRKLDGRLARALMSIQAVKGVEIGDGFAAAASPGSAVGDEIYYSRERGLYRMTNRAGGIEGGMTNGQPVVVRAAMKPIPTLRRPLASVDLATKEPVAAAYERSDICAVPAACVIGEAVMAWELAAACLEKFGGDTLDEVREALVRYRERLGAFES